MGAITYIDWGAEFTNPKNYRTSTTTGSTSNPSYSPGGWITDEQITTVLNGGTIHPGPNGPPSMRDSNLSWLDRRVNEVRVRL